MDHAFPSHRTYVEDAKRGRQLTMDVLAIAAADDHDRRCIIERRDPDIDATPVRDAVTRNASRLGLCMDDLSSLLPTESRADLTALRAPWISYVASGAPLPSSPLTRAMTHASDAFSRSTTEHEAYEDDDGSSSASDYSDSETQTSSDDGSGHEEDDEEESETSP